VSPGTVAIRLAALRFFYIKTLKKSWSIAETPYPQKNRRLPTILSQKEVEQLIHAARTQRERILLMTLYATGARNAELIPRVVKKLERLEMAGLGILHRLPV